MSAVLRIVPFGAPEPMTGDASIRPTCFDDFVGQRDVIDNLRTSVRAAKRGGWQHDHTLFTGPKGLGKTSLATVMAAELGAQIRVTSAPAIGHKGELASILTSLSTGDVLFIDEIHRLKIPLQETLYPALEDRVLDMTTGSKVIRVPLPRFTLVGATTHAGMLSPPLLDRFGLCFQLQSYDIADLANIVMQSADKLQIEIEPEGATEIARRSRGTPRLANRLLRRVRDFAIGTDIDCGQMAQPIAGPLAIVALSKLRVDDSGLDTLDRAYLAAVSMGPIGIEAIASALSEQRTTIEEVIEPFLVQIGFVVRTSRGRVLTAAGFNHWRATSG